MDNLLKELQNIIFEYVDGDIIVNEVENLFDKCVKNHTYLCANKYAIHIIERKLQYEKYLEHLCYNENAIYLIEKNLDKFTSKEYHNLVNNKKSISILDKYLKTPLSYPDPDIINLSILCDSVSVDIIYKKYPNIFQKNLSELNWISLSSNKNAIYFLNDIFKHGETHPYFHRIDWTFLCANEGIVQIDNKKKLYIQKFIENVVFEGENNKYYEKLVLGSFCYNKNCFNKDKGESIISDYLTNIIEEGETHPLFYKISWKNLCYNENSVYIKDKEGKQSLIEKIINEGETNPYFNKLCWENLCKNKSYTYIIRNIIKKGENHSLYCKIDWCYLCENDDTTDIILENIDKIEINNDYNSDKNKLSSFTLCYHHNIWDKYSDKCLRKLYE